MSLGSVGEAELRRAWRDTKRRDGRALLGAKEVGAGQSEDELHKEHAEAPRVAWRNWL